MLINKILKDYKVILASTSPRRKQLLEQCDVEFCVSAAYDVEEVYPLELGAEKVASFLAELKASKYPFDVCDKDIVISADTVVIVDNKVLGKPENSQQAKDMLLLLSGCEHTVTTAYSIRTCKGIATYSVDTKVVFAELELDDIEYYIVKYRPFDKAGAYGIQEWIGCIGVKSISGSFYNVMGLPVHSLLQSIKEVVAELEALQS